jgi:putative transposase
MARFRDIKTLRKSAAVHASVCNYFDLARHFTSRNRLKHCRSAALTEWRQLAA